MKYMNKRYWIRMKHWEHGTKEETFESVLKMWVYIHENMDDGWEITCGKVVYG